MMNFEDFYKRSLEKWNNVTPEKPKSEARKFTEQLDAYAEIMNTGSLRGDISSGYAYEVRTTNSLYPNSFQKAFYEYVLNDIESTKKRFNDIMNARIAMKHKELDTADINQIIKKEKDTMFVNYHQIYSEFCKHPVFLPEIEDVIFNPPATIVLWKDKSKTVVKTQNGEHYDPEKGLAMCILKKVYGNKGRYFNNISKWTDKYWKKKEAEEEAKYREMLREETVNNNQPEEDRFKISFKSKEELKLVLKGMKDLISKYGFVTVEDMRNLMGINSVIKIKHRGWTSLDDARVRMLKSGNYRLYLPPCKLIV